MLEVYCTGCISCHKVIKRLNISNTNMSIISDEKIVSNVVSDTFGVVPVFKFEGKYYNEYDIDRMLNEGIDFNRVEEIVKPIIKSVKEEIIKKE